MQIEKLPWHQDLWGRVVVLQRAARLPHAMLLSGPEGLGKACFAQRLAATLVCAHSDATGDACGRCRDCMTQSAGSHPDVITVEPEEPGRQIPIDMIRSAISRSVLTADAASAKILLVTPADRLSRGAANALLKTLEEPVPRTFLMLITPNPHQLPATIRSRCQHLRLTVPDVKTAVSWLEPHANSDIAIGALGLAGGAPLKALELAENGTVELLSRMFDDLNRLLQGRVGSSVVAAQWQDLDLQVSLGFLLQWVTDLIRLKMDADPPILFHTNKATDLQCTGQRIESRNLFLLRDAVVRILRQSEHNLNGQLALERLLGACSQLITH